MSKTLSAKYHQENKKKNFKKKACEKYQNLSKDVREKKRQYGRESYKMKIANVEKQKLVEYRKKYYRMRKKHFIIIIKKYFNLILLFYNFNLVF